MVFEELDVVSRLLVVVKNVKTMGEVGIVMRGEGMVLEESSQGECRVVVQVVDSQMTMDRESMKRDEEVECMDMKVVEVIVL